MLVDLALDVVGSQLSRYAVLPPAFFANSLTAISCHHPEPK